MARRPTDDELSLRMIRLRECMRVLGENPCDPEAAIVVQILVRIYGATLPEERGAQAQRS